jgi:hypothetical protein
MDGFGSISEGTLGTFTSSLFLDLLCGKIVRRGREGRRYR